MKLAVAAALLGLAQAGNIPYKNCGSSNDLLQNVKVSANPDPPVPGQTVNVDIDGTLKGTVKSGNYKFSVEVDGITVISKQGDLCDLTSCPIAAGPVKVTKSESLPSSVPPGSYTLKISATADGNEPLFCADATLKVSDADMIEAQKDLEFEAFIKEYGRTYLPGTVEYGERRKIFGANLDTIRETNARYEAGEITYFLRVNDFADLSYVEFSQRLGFIAPQSNSTKYPTYEPTDEEWAKVQGGESVDWTQRGVVTPVKNQGSNCGSCWSFSTTGSIESRSAIKTGKLISLSEQQLMDCSTNGGNDGCHGGGMGPAMQYVAQTGGLATEQCDSYQARQESCQWQQLGCQLNDPIKGPQGVGQSEKALMAAVYQGPVSVGVDASGNAWQLYGGGVFGANGECAQNLDHGILAVGYGSQNGQDFWKVKNSWGRSWGQGGYMLLSRGNNACGITDAAVFPVV